MNPGLPASRKSRRRNGTADEVDVEDEADEEEEGTSTSSTGEGVEPGAPTPAPRRPDGVSMLSETSRETRRGRAQTTGGSAGSAFPGSASTSRPGQRSRRRARRQMQGSPTCSHIKLWQTRSGEDTRVREVRLAGPFWVASAREVAEVAEVVAAGVEDVEDRRSPWKG